MDLERKRILEETTNGSCGSYTMIAEIKSDTGDVLLATRELIRVFETKVDKLLDKGVIPVEVFKWLIVFVLGFSFLCFFGVEVAKDLISKIPK